MSGHGALYPQALYNDLTFELRLADASNVVIGSDPAKLVYKLTNIQLEYEMVRSKQLADEATSVYTHGKEFAYDHIMRETMVSFAKNTDTRLNIRVNPQSRSLRGILLLFIDPSRAGAIYQSRHHQSSCHSKRLPQQGLQREHRCYRHVEGN